MITRSSKPVLLFAVMAAVMIFGFYAAAMAGQYECSGQPDMTAFGFVANPKPNCDRDFVRKAEDSQMLEVAIGRRAVEMAVNADIRQFGKIMAKDNSLAVDRLREIAQNDNLGVLRDMDREGREPLLHLSKIKGRDFDLEYMNLVIGDQECNLRLFERIADEAANPDLRKYARQTIPAMREHLRMARDIYKRIESRE
jgi:putative membrane protein